MSAAGAPRDAPMPCADCGGPHEKGSIFCERQALPEAPSLVGKVVGEKYRVVRRIAEGGMAAVFEAENQVIRKRVALKVLLSHLLYSEVAVSRFYREARTLAALGHENIVQVFDFGVTEEHVPFMVMELLEGKDLGDLLAERGRLESGQAVWIVSQVLAGLDAAHAAGIVHRDLKPENVIIVGHGPGKEAVKLLDFGISLARGEGGSVRLTAQRTLVGTARYMAPEQITRPSDVDARADIHAVGALLYELCAGRPPFDCEDWRETLRLVTEASPVSLSRLAPDVPAGLCAVAHRALEKDPARRFQSAGEMLDALGPFLQWRNTGTILSWTLVPRRAEGGAETIEVPSPTSVAMEEPAPSRPRTVSEAHPSRSPRRVWLAVLAGGAVVLSLVLFVFIWSRPDAPPTPRSQPRAPSTVRVTLGADPPGSRMWLDGRALSQNPIVVDLEPNGEHVLSAVAPDHEGGQINFRATDRSRVQISLRPVISATAVAGPAPDRPEVARPPQRHKSGHRVRRGRREVIESNPYR